MFRIAIAVAAFAAMGSNAAIAQDSPRFGNWPTWMWQQHMGYCEKSSQLSTGRIADRIDYHGETVDAAVAKLAEGISKMAEEQKVCLNRHKNGGGIYIGGMKSNFSASEQADIDRAANGAEADLRRYLDDSRAYFLRNPVNSFEYTRNMEYWGGRFDKSVKWTKSVSAGFKGFREVCGSFDFSKRPAKGDPAVKTKLDAYTECAEGYSHLTYPGGPDVEFGSGESWDRDSDDENRLESLARRTQVKAFKCTQKNSYECFGYADVGSVSEFKKAKKRMVAYAPYVCSRYSAAGCIPDREYNKLAGELTDANMKFMVDWDARFEAERKLAKAELEPIGKYAYLLKWGFTYEELMARNKQQ